MSKQKGRKADPVKQIPSQSHSHAPIKEYTLITLEQNHALQIKNENLIQRVRNSTVFIEDAETAVQNQDKAKSEQAEWQAYLNCDKLPKPFEPETVRNFMYKISQFENEDVENTINWLLGVDERSILNQDIDSVNLTKRFLQNERGNFGDQYDVRINEVMAVSTRIEYFLEKPTRDLSERKLYDVKEMEFLAHKQIDHFIDNLTYRILCSEQAYMSAIDVTTAEYSHQGQHFGIHLWTFKNVPLCLDPEEIPSKKVKLYQIKVELVMPFSVLCENMVIRGLHCHFDHFSALARYFALPETDDEDSQNLITCLKREWETQKKIQVEVRASMVKQREDFEEALRLKAEEEELKAKQLKQKDGKDAKARSKKPDPSAKPKKGPKEPPIITPDLVPQIREDFLKYDHLEYEEGLRKFHPDTFALSNGEVNLRKYQILGGVYQLNCLSKPKADSFPKLIMAWYRTNKSVRYKSVHSELGNADDISKFFQVTFELPEHFCHWGEPIPCLFEESTASRSSNDIFEIANLLHIGSPVIINDFNLHELFTKALMYDFIEHSMPRVISSFKFPEDLYNEDEDKKPKKTLGRTKPTTNEDENREKELVMQRQLLSFDVQNCPERLFPFFKKVFPVVILPTQEQGGKRVVHPYEHFSDFISALEAIKESYCRSSFKDNRGNPIKISADKYEKNIGRHRKETITSKLVVHGKSGSTLFQTGSRESLSQADVLRKSLGENPKALSKASKMSRVKERVSGVGGGEEEEMPSKWSTANILKTQFIASDRKVTVWTDRLGTFGFAFNRYQHFPFQHWSLQPCKENPQEVELTVESAFAVFRIYVTPDGYKASVTDFTKYYKSRKVYLEIKEPVSDIKTLKERLRQKHLNIFPERDAALYVTGYFSEKHLASELHTYNCISLYATSLQFGGSLWNKLSDRRSMVLKLGELRDVVEDFHLLRVTPEDVTFVDVRELCTDLETVELEYTPTWRNIEWYPDLNHLITSTFNDAGDMRLKDPSVICYTKQLLRNIRPFSFS